MPGTLKGTSKQVMGITVGGDQDDWTLAATGVPSVTAELGDPDQFINEWQVKDAVTATQITNSQAPWLEYVFKHLPEYHSVI